MSLRKIRVRMIKIYAAIMKFLAPMYCVRELIPVYKEGLINWDAKFFLLGTEQELEAIEKLQLDDDALKAREWSYGTVLELLKRDNFALVSRIKTEEAFDIVLKHGDINLICKAMNVFTPSKGYLLNLMHHWNREKLLAVIADVPNAFDSLKEWEILGVEEKQAYEGEELWAVACALVKANPEEWAKGFINEVMKIVPKDLNKEACETLKLCVEKAMQCNVDISESMPYLKDNYTDLYAFVRASLGKLDVAIRKPYVLKMFPQFVDKLSTNFNSLYGENSPSEWEKSSRKLSEDQEAACWLSFALISNTVNLVVNNLLTIKNRISAEAFADVESEVLRFSDLEDVDKLVHFYANCPEKQPKFRDFLLECVGSTDQGTLKNYYPFDGWAFEQAEKAVRAMAVGKTLPEDLSALPEKLQKVAVEELEIQSEIALISSGTKEEKAILVAQKLHPRSEEFLFSHYYSATLYYAPTYIENFCMEESSFKYLVNVRDADGYKIDGYVSNLIKQHAEKWGLTEKNYRDLMQSKYYSKLAAVLKKYCKVESRQPSFEDGV